LRYSSVGYFSLPSSVISPAHRDAAEHVVRKVVFLGEKMHVVRRDQPDAELFRQLGQFGIDRVLFLDVLLDFDE
jgi:hypothetical protein